jgi:CheY-like chemotaxis protein
MDTQDQDKTQSKNILCIEDEHFISELYARALTKYGYKVTAIADGKEALKVAKTNDFDIILLDLMVPNLTGIEILKALKDPDVKPPIKAKVIIITNLEQSDEVRAAIEKQADGYLVKANLTPHEVAEYVSKID